jgi:AcrR family transcriptional regulator
MPTSTVAETSFVRARSADQRAARRAAILAAAADMLADGTLVSELSLNGLAKRVGLAKSNVLRYFETREAVLLELLDAEFSAWLDEVAAASDAAPVRGDDPVTDVARLLADTVADRPVLVELLAHSALVLEHNVSAEVAADYKRRSIAQAARLVDLMERRVGPLPSDARLAASGAVILVVGGAWGMCRPSAGMSAAYERYPDLAAARLDYRLVVRELIATTLAGLRVRPVDPTP